LTTAPTFIATCFGSIVHVLAYSLKRMIAILGVQPLTQAMRAG
jgi:hypothetical protein